MGLGGFAVSEHTVCDRDVNNKVEKVCMEIILLKLKVVEICDITAKK